MAYTNARAMAERTKRTRGIKTNQSALFRWFMVRHDEIAPRMAHPDWTSLCDEVRQEGVTKPDRSLVTPIYVRQTWWKVSRLKAKLIEKVAATEAAKAANRQAREAKEAADLAEAKTGAEANAAKAADDIRRRKEFYGPRPTRSWASVHLGEGGTSPLKIICTGPAPWDVETVPKEAPPTVPAPVVRPAPAAPAPRAAGGAADPE